jgi:hypothetical protein
MQYYKKSAERKNKGAYFNIALLYYYGIGVEKDYTISFAWFEKVVEGEIYFQKQYVYVQREEDYPDTVDSTESKSYFLVKEEYIYWGSYLYLRFMRQKGQVTDIYNDKAL